ncbi:MAG: hypothetical protein EBS85_01430 [Micrococcales bacterium]|nr:hypothetical protein [Actinomycetota bacterium]NCA07380.1 hypothetical protein [Micrococcales bacterium]
MLALSTFFLVASLNQAPSCPTAFTLTNTTIGAISNSAQLSLCVSKAALIQGSNGSITLVIGSNAAAPKCLIYPNGVNLDLMSSLLQSGHVGCWSLYPPTQPVAVVNVGKPSQVRLAAALKSFRPATQRIFLKPRTGILSGSKVQLSSSASLQKSKAKLLGLSALVRFKPISHSWSISDSNSTVTKSALTTPSYVPRSAGKVFVNLAVTYSVEYLFSGLTGWASVKPNIILNSPTIAFMVSEVRPPVSVGHIPRLVAKPCLPGIRSWGC